MYFNMTAIMSQPPCVEANWEGECSFVCRSLLPVLQKMIKIGTPKQAKHAIRCIDTICKNKAKIFEGIFEVRLHY